MVPFEFTAKSIEKLNNRLFASNIQEIAWDVDFDARAYRCASDKQVKLESSDSSKTIVGLLSADGKILSNQNNRIEIPVPEEHDCINPSNVDVLNSMVYQYQADGKTRGGVGPNVSYKFIYTELVLSDEVIEDENEENLLLNVSGSIKSIKTYYEDGTECTTTSVAESGRKIIPNYADPYICSNFLGYQRDEIYRFGIIFYNKKNIPSPVHWIGDIRMPSTSDANKVTSLIFPFHKGVESASYGQVNELVAYALGIEFTVKNIDTDVLSYEIVRCDRNEKDRTVITQGILGALFNFNDWGKNEHTAGEHDVRPAPTFNLASEYRTKYNIVTDQEGDNHINVDGYFEFVSSEICISKDSILANISNGILVPLYKTNSAYGTRITIPQESIYTVSTVDGGIAKNDSFGDVSFVDNIAYLYVGHRSGDAHYGYAGVSKYYNNSLLEDELKIHLDIEDGIISNTLPYFMKFEDARNYGQLIGNKTYINTSVGGFRQFGNHGVSAVLQVTKDFKPHKDPTSAVDFCTALISNIKQNTIPYGGNTYISRKNSVYNSCGGHSPVTSNTVYCYGGDTYLNVLDYLNTSMIQRSNDVNDWKQRRLCCISYIPLESQVNLNLRSDDSYHRTVKEGVGQNLVQHEPTALPNGYVQKKPYYEYNPVYSATSGSKHYIPKSVYFIDNALNQTRIVASEAKTNNELINSWTTFKFANYLDVDGQYGPITNLKAFNNKLYYWQNSAVGIASVNDRSLITDNNMAELTLGTGGILTRYDYITTLNGSSIINDKSITNSATTMYWYDLDKNEICMIGNGVTPLSKLKSVQSYLNTLSKKSKTNAVSFYDKKYNEVWFRLYDKTLIYNEQLQAFTSFYTHNPNWFFPFSDKLVTIKDNNMYYLHNIYEINSNLKEERLSKIEFVVNKDVSNTIVFDNVVFSADLLDNDNTIPAIV